MPITHTYICPAHIIIQWNFSRIWENFVYIHNIIIIIFETIPHQNDTFFLHMLRRKTSSSYTLNKMISYIIKHLTLPKNFAGQKFMNTSVPYVPHRWCLLTRLCICVCVWECRQSCLIPPENRTCLNTRQ